MDREKLNDYLEELKKETEKLELIDPQAAERLKELTNNIEKTMATQGEDNAGKELNDGIQGNLEHFEREHPSVTSILNRIATLLSDMGI